MTPKQQRFVEEYLLDLNATQAAIRAGYSAKNADVTGPRLLGNVGIAAAVAKAVAERTKTTALTADQVLAELSGIGSSDIGDIVDFSTGVPRFKATHEIPERARRAISAVKVTRRTEGKGDDAVEVEMVEFKLWSKDSALNMLGKYHGLLVDRHEHTGKDGAPLLGLDAVRAVLKSA